MMDDAIWTVRRILSWIEDYLRKHGDGNPRLSAQWLVAESLGVSRVQLFMDMERPLTEDERTTLRDFTKRRAAGEPLQYITGSVDFRHIQLRVRDGVLIPRPETEVLVSEALALLPSAPKPQAAYDEAIARLLKACGDSNSDGTNIVDGPGVNASNSFIGGNEIESNGEIAYECSTGKSPNDKPNEQMLLVADICTGTGCIACSIAFEHPLTHVVATDISKDAVLLARENVSLLELDDRVEVLSCDLGSEIDESLLGCFDLVVSNPPYIPTAVLSEIPREVSEFEPSIALDGGPDGLVIFRRLLEWCSIALKPDGCFAFELHESCLDEAALEAERAGFCNLRIVKDLAERPRILTGRRP